MYVTRYTHCKRYQVLMSTLFYKIKTAPLKGAVFILYSWLNQAIFSIFTLVHDTCRICFSIGIDEEIMP